MTKAKRAKPKPRAEPKPRAKSKPRQQLLRVKRVYDDLGPSDGLRILIDRLWPRGLSKAKLKLDAWPRELSPSTELRRWYNHDPARYAAFRGRYRAELAEHRDALAELRTLIKGHVSTLLTATSELDLSHGRVLCELLERPPPKRR